MKKLNLNKGMLSKVTSKIKGFSKKKKIVLGVTGLFLVINAPIWISFAVDGAIVTDKEKQQQEEYDRKLSEKMEQDKQIEANKSDDEKIRDLINPIFDGKLVNVEYLKEGKCLNIQFNLIDNLTPKLMLGAAESREFKTLELLKSNQWVKDNVKDILFEGYAIMVDSYGNESNNKVMMNRFNMNDINKMNFKNLTESQLMLHDEAGFIHPALRK